MERKMPFNQWLEACADLAGLHHRLRTAGFPEALRTLDECQHALENGALAVAAEHLGALAVMLNDHPMIQSRCEGLLLSIQAYDSVAPR